MQEQLNSKLKDVERAASNEVKLKMQHELEAMRKIAEEEKQRYHMLMQSNRREFDQKIAALEREGQQNKVELERLKAAYALPPPVYVPPRKTYSSKSAKRVYVTDRDGRGKYHSTRGVLVHSRA